MTGGKFFTKASSRKMPSSSNLQIFMTNPHGHNPHDHNPSHLRKRSVANSDPGAGTEWVTEWVTEQG